MPAIGNIVVNDGATTPVAHTFGPAGIEGQTANYADRAGGIPIGYNTISLTLRPPSPKSLEPMYLLTARTVNPILEVTSPSTASGIQPAPTVAYKLIAESKYWLPERSSLQNRKDVSAEHKNLLAHATFTAMVENLESVY